MGGFTPMLRIVVVAQFLVGLVLHLGSLREMTKNISDLKRGPLRLRWNVLRAIVLLLAISYMGYIAQLLAEGEEQAGIKEDLLVGAAAVLVSLFVYGVADLSFQTVKDFRDISRFKELAHQDQLTGVFNRRYFDLTLEEAVKIALCKKEPLSLMAVDIDHFKSVNDEYGHLSGDTVLRSVCGAIMRQCRHTDIVARYGGDELMIIVSGDAATAVTLAERVKTMVENLEIELATHATLRVTVSIGLATITFGDSPDTLFTRADAALYEAKRLGRNRIEIVSRSRDDSDITELSVRRQTLTGEKGLILYQQPVADDAFTLML
jgi:diguanylate cyclase (GGDEF)-like protein